jgi:hypothetical protein
MTKNEVVVKNELIPVESINVPDLFTNRKMVDSLLNAIDKKAKEHKPDLSTDASRKRIASNAAKVSRSKTFLDGLGKDFVAARKAEIKETDNLRKLIRDTLDSLRDEVRRPLTEYEKAEKKRIAEEKALAEFLADWDDAIAENDLFDRQREIERREAELRRQEEERKAKEETERKERERKEREERLKKEAAEKAKKEAEEAARHERERIEQEKREAEERATQAERERLAAIEKAKREAEEAEQRRIEAAKQAELDRKEAERRAVERSENERLAKEKAEREKAERLAQRKAHRRKINNAALTCFEQNGIDSETAKVVITMIADGRIDYIVIQY